MSSPLLGADYTAASLSFTESMLALIGKATDAGLTSATIEGCLHEALTGGAARLEKRCEFLEARLAEQRVEADHGA